jgi:hypothetical protein
MRRNGPHDLWTVTIAMRSPRSKEAESRSPRSKEPTPASGDQRLPAWTTPSAIPYRLRRLEPRPVTTTNRSPHEVT